MAWAHVVTTTGPDGTTTAATTVALTIPAVGNNNLIVGMVVYGGGTGSPTVADDKGNTYTVIDVKNDATDAVTAAVFYKEGITNAPTVITATFINNWFRRLTVSEYSGIATTSAIDGHIGALRQPPPAAGANNIVSGNITTTFDGDLIYGGVIDNPGSGTVSYTAGTSPIAFTQRVNSSAGGVVLSLVAEDFRQTTAGTIQTTFGQSATTNCMVWAVAFKDAGGAAPTPGPDKALSNPFRRMPGQKPWRLNHVPAVFVAGRNDYVMTAVPAAFVTTGSAAVLTKTTPGLPNLITTISLGLAPAGPYKAASGSYYAIGQSTSDARALTAIKASNPASAWINVGTDAIINTSDTIYDISCYRVGDVLHLSVIMGLANIYYVKFDMSTDTWSAVETLQTGFDPSTSASANPLSSAIVVRSNGEVVVIYNGSRVSSHSRIVAKRRTTGGTWGAADGVTDPTPIDAGSSTVDYIDGYALLGASDRVHFHWRDTSTSAAMHRSLSSANTLSSSTGPYGNFNQYGLNPRGVSYNNAGTQKVYLTGWDNSRLLTGIYYDSGATPTISATTGSASGTVDSPTRAFVDGTNIYVTYNTVTSFDIWVAKSTDNGATFSGHVLVHSGIPSVTEEQRFAPGQSVCGEVYTRGTNVVVPFIVRDNSDSQWFYDEYIIRSSGPQAYTLTATVGTFNVTGVAARTAYSHMLPAVTGSFTVTGVAANLRPARFFRATVTTFNVASVGARIVAARTMLAATGAFTTTGVAAGLRHGFVPLTAVKGTFTVTGTAAGVAFGHATKTVVGPFNVTGVTAGLRFGHVLVAAPAAFTVGGVPAALTYRHNYPIATVVGPFNVTGVATGLLATRKLPLTVGTFSVAGTATGLKFGHALVATTGTFNVAGVAAGLRFGRVLKTVVGPFNVTGIATNFLFNHVSKAVVGTFAVNGIATGLRRAYNVVAAPGAFSVTGQSVTLKYTRVMPAATGTFTVNGIAANLVYSNAGLYSLPAAAGAFTVTGVAANFKWIHVLKAVTGTFSVAGTTTLLTASRRTAAAVGSFTVTGVAARLAMGYRTVTSVGTFTLNGVAAALRGTRKVAAATGAFTVNGVAANLVYSAAGHYVLPATTGTFVVSGALAPLTQIHRMLAAPGSFSVTGLPVALREAHRSVAVTGAFVVNGNDANLVRGTAVVSGVKVWMGAAWTQKPTKVWTGSAWTQKPVKTWNGSVWR